MKNSVYIFLFCFTNLLQAQHITEKSFAANGIANIIVDGENVFKIVVEAKPVDTIRIHSRVEGENNEDIVLVAENKNRNLYIAAKIQPLFKDANDKLSAHKVISIELVIVIPENKELLINSNIATVIVKGQYKNVTLSLSSGNCFFQEYKGDAKIYTIDGNIALQTNQAKLSITSKNGAISKEEIDVGSHEVLIKTINGNVTITKSQ
ncbi:MULTISPECIES: hypothetical protein [unclassified Lacinutrix]